MSCCVKISAWPFVRLKPVSMEAAALPSGANRLVCRVISRVVSEALVTAVCTRTVAGVVRQESARAAGFIRGGKRAFDAPVMRQVELAPVGVGEFRLFRARRVGLQKTPVRVKIFRHARASLR